MHHADCRFDTSSIAVISYAGWGVAGTNILFRLDKTLKVGSPPPVTPPPPSPAAGAALPGTTPAPPTSLPSPNGGSSWTVIVGITVGVGGALVLATLLLVVVVVRARRWAYQRAVDLIREGIHYDPDFHS